MSWRLTQSGECVSSHAINSIWVIPPGPLLTLRLLSLYLLPSGKRSQSNMFLFSCCYSSVCRSVVEWWVFNLSSKWSCSSAGNCGLKVETKAFESITTQWYDVRRGKFKQMEERLKIVTSNSLSWNTCMLVNCSYTTVPSQTNWCWARCILKYIQQYVLFLICSLILPRTNYDLYLSVLIMLIRVEFILSWNFISSFNNYWNLNLKWTFFI